MSDREMWIVRDAYHSPRGCGSTDLSAWRDALANIHDKSEIGLLTFAAEKKECGWTCERVYTLQEAADLFLRVAEDNLEPKYYDQFGKLS